MWSKSFYDSFILPSILFFPSFADFCKSPYSSIIHFDRTPRAFAEFSHLNVSQRQLLPSHPPKCTILLNSSFFSTPPSSSSCQIQTQMPSSLHYLFLQLAALVMPLKLSPIILHPAPSKTLYYWSRLLRTKTYHLHPRNQGALCLNKH